MRVQPELACVVCSSVSAKLPPGPYGRRAATYAANSGHLDVARAPRSAIDPRELNWDPARDSSVVVAGIVTGCAEFYSGR